MTSRWWPRRRERGAPPPTVEEWPEAWREALVRHVPGWRTLTEDARARLTELTDDLMNRFRWEAAKGFAVEDTMRVVIAANAALLVLELGADCYSQVTSVILHPSTITFKGDRPGPIPGSVIEGSEPLDGEAHHRGPVLLSWDAVRTDTRHPARGLNVVLHEFAHRLDMLDGLTNGTPPLGDLAREQRWVEVCTREYDALRRGEPDSILRQYGAENVAEFFAVATEVFFCWPRELREAKPDLYEVLQDFYAQDPAARATVMLPDQGEQR